MINIVNGNILDAKEDIIVHQVNVQGVMGGGVARQLADRYEYLEKLYSEYCKEYNNDYEKLKGKVFICGIDDKIICNMFSQEPNFNTDYIAMKEALEYIKLCAKKSNKTISIPYGIGCRYCQWGLEYSV